MAYTSTPVKVPVCTTNAVSDEIAAGVLSQ